ncbi:alpha/beta fold hydrolase [Tersicoccus sp. MR15.9]|uniref:alpha/beta fold hydrolase n=1 Tax=Tersicoccus mangrovi TaxID=3121635 RepID=UPI002FE5CD72
MEPFLTRSYRQDRIAVRGGDLTVGVWEPVAGLDDDAVAAVTPHPPITPTTGYTAVEPPAAAEVPTGPRTILLLHGLTGHHQAFLAVADRLDAYRVLAPDLRGRGQSYPLLGPYGMAAHADDLAQVLEAEEARDVVVVGYSMGGLAALVLAHRYPGLVQSLVLLDMWLPRLAFPSEDRDATVSHIFAPLFATIERRYASLDEYHRFWERSGRFDAPLSEQARAALDYALHGREPELGIRVQQRAAWDDAIEVMGAEDVLAALNGLSHPARLLWHRAGHAEGAAAWDIADSAESWASLLPTLTAVEYPADRRIPLFTDDGVARIRAAVDELARS